MVSERARGSSGVGIVENLAGKIEKHIFERRLADGYTADLPRQGADEGGDKRRTVGLFKAHFAIDDARAGAIVPRPETFGDASCQHLRNAQGVVASIFGVAGRALGKLSADRGMMVSSGFCIVEGGLGIRIGGGLDGYDIASDAFSEARGRVEGDESAPLEYGQAVATFGVFHEMRGHGDGYAVVSP